MTLVRIGSNWAHREPEPGVYYWDSLDERINALHENSASILFTIPANCPDWDCGEVTANETCVFQDEDAVRQITAKPLIVSEFGGPSSAFEKYSQAYHARRLELYLLTLQSLPIEEAYYFNLVDNPATYHSRSGLFTVNRRKKEAFNIMQRMLGARD